MTLIGCRTYENFADVNEVDCCDALFRAPAARKHRELNWGAGTFNRQSGYRSNRGSGGMAFP